MRRRITAFLLAVVAILTAAPSQAQAYELYPSGFNNSSIADGTLHVCFEPNTPVNTHKDGIMVGVRTWSYAKNITFISNGICDDDGSNIEIYWDTIPFPCSRGAITTIWTGTYSIATIQFNQACGETGFHWNSNTATPNGKWDSATVGMHEAGHALGIDHEDRVFDPFGNFDPGGHNGVLDLMDTAPCAVGQSSYLSSDDAAAIRNRYPAIANYGIDGITRIYKSPAPCYD